MLSNVSPIKKLIVAMAAVCVVISVITANNLASVMSLVAARNNSKKEAEPKVVVHYKDSEDGTQNDDGADSDINDGTSDDGSGANDGTNDGSGTNDGEDSGENNGSGTNNGTGTNNGAGNNTGSNTGANAGTNSGSTSSKPKNTAEIVSLYNKAVNNAKSNAKTVIRVKDGATNYKGIAEAGGLSSAASTLMGAFMVKSKDDIQVKNETWSKDKLPPENAKAGLKVAGVSSASCKEEGNYYILTIAGKNETNPKSGGQGVGSLCGVIQEETITGSISSVPGLSLSGISIAYENVKTVAKIEKSTGNLVELTVDAPCILSLSAKLGFIKIDNARVGIGVYTEYKISY